MRAFVLSSKSLGLGLLGVAAAVRAAAASTSNTQPSFFLQDPTDGKCVRLSDTSFFYKYHVISFNLAFEVAAQLQTQLCRTSDLASIEVYGGRVSYVEWPCIMHMSRSRCFMDHTVHVEFHLPVSRMFQTGGERVTLVLASVDGTPMSVYAFLRYQLVPSPRSEASIAIVKVVNLSSCHHYTVRVRRLCSSVFKCRTRVEHRTGSRTMLNCNTA